MRIKPRTAAVTIVLTFSVASLRAQTLDHYYSFDSAEVTLQSGRITSATGTGSTLFAFHGGPTPDASGRFGEAANFSLGSLDSTIFKDGNTPLGSSFSISFWMKTSDVTAISQSYVFQTGGVPSPQNAILFGYNLSVLELYGNAFTGADPRPISGLTLNPSLNNQWFNVVYTYDGADLKGYLNGVEQFDRAAVLSMTASGGLSVGGSRNSNPPNAALIPGSLDDVAIFTGALSQQQVTLLQTSPAITVVPEPRGYVVLGLALLVGHAVWRRRKG